MRESKSLWFKAFFEFIPKDEVSSLPNKTRGLYVLYREDEVGNLNLVYVGMTDSGAKGRIYKHSAGEKSDKWTHCSVYQVWDNITHEQIEELEAFLRQMLRKDASANSLAKQKGSKRFFDLKKDSVGLKGVAA